METVEENKYAEDVPSSTEAKLKLDAKEEETTIATEPATSGMQPVAHIEVPDGGYGWVVVIAVFFVHVFVLGNMYSFGVFYPTYIDAFDGDEAAVAWVGSVGACLMVGLGVWTGEWADRYGNERVVFVGAVFVGVGFLLASFATELWHLYLTQGVLAGIGYSLAFIAGVSVVGQWFSKRRGLAVGIAVAGSGLGQFAISQITGGLISSGGWRYALRILALICFVGLALCSLGIRRLLPRVTHTSGQSSLHYFKERNFSVLYFGSLLNSLGMLMPYTYLPLYAEDHGVSRSASVLIISMVGISSAVGRIAVGFFADKIGKILMFQVCILLGGASTLCWLACKDFGSLMAYGIVYGFFAGGVISLMPGVAAELFGIKKLGGIIGLLYSSTAVGNLLSAPIGGFLLAAAKSYTPSIAVAGAFLLSGMVFILFLDMKAAHKEEHVAIPQAPPASEPEDKETGQDTGYEMVNLTDEVNAGDDTDPNAIPEEYEMPL